MSPRELIRPNEAAKRFGISKRTLSRWRSTGLIGWCRVDGVVWLDARDVEDVRQAAYVPRQIVPISHEMIRTNAIATDDWLKDPVWANGGATR